MCDFFSFVTIPAEKKYLYFDWKQRQAMKFENCDSHSYIVKHYEVTTDDFNAYEYNPLTKQLVVDAINGKDDSKQALKWARSLDFKTIIEPLIIKPIVNPFELPEATVTPEDIELLKLWASVRDSVWASVRDSVWASVRDSVWASVGASVRDSVRDSVWASVWASVRDSVWASVWASVRDSVRDSVWASVWASVRDSVWASVGASVRDSVGDSVGASVRDSVGAYIGSFFDIEYKYDFSPAVKLWERGLVASYDGTTWRLHTGKDAKIVYEWQKG